MTRALRLWRGPLAALAALWAVLQCFDGSW